MGGPGVAERALDLLNILLSDVRYGLGAYLGVYLLTEHGWDAAEIGLALSIGGFAGLLPVTAGVDGSSAWGLLRRSRPLLVFALTGALFHMANASMLTLVAQKLALQNIGWGIALTATCAIAAQSVMVPAAALAGARADALGRRPLLLAAFVALTLRGLLQGNGHHRFLDLSGGAVLQDRLAAADLGQGQLTAFVVQFLEAVEAVTAVAQHLAGLADIAELAGQL